MNNEKLTEAAEMEREKKEAPGRRLPDQGQDGDTRRNYFTPSIGANQEHRSQPACVQGARLLAMLRRGPVSTLEARAACIMSPASRVFELRKIGLEITTTRLENRIAIYHLIDPPRRPGNDE